MSPEEIEKYEKIKEDISKQIKDSIIEEIEVNDSFFYAKMSIAKGMDVSSFSEKLRATIKIKLFNSKEFEYPNRINERPKMLEAKEIVTTVEVDEFQIRNKEDMMMIVYEEIGKQLAADLFQANASNVHMVANSLGRTYI